MRSKRIFITGGTGFLGKALIKRYYLDNEITVFSRDESKQYFLKQIYPKVNFICGDVRNYDLMKRASRNHDIGIYAASFKQIQSCHDNYEEASKVIIEGAFHGRRCSEENGFEASCFISTDKSRSATTIYGAMKYVAGESFISNVDNSNTRFSTVIYGNVLNSTGSVIPLIWSAIKNNKPLDLYSVEMTRFLVSVEQAIDLIEIALKYNGVSIIPKLKSCRIHDLFKIYADKFGLKYAIQSPRSGEKIHEILVSSEELNRMYEDKEHGVYVLHPRTTFSKSFLFPNNEYSSRDMVIYDSELDELLQRNDYFK